MVAEGTGKDWGRPSLGLKPIFPETYFIENVRPDTRLYRKLKISSVLSPGRPRPRSRPDRPGLVELRGAWHCSSAITRSGS
jgi:hypothetical protein